LPLGFVIFHLQHFGESKDFYQIGFYFLNIQVLHSLDILKQEDIYDIQIDQICSKISSTIYLLSKIKKYLYLESRQLFYSGYILPLIDYCCVVWGNCSNEGLNRILKLYYNL
jgi:hypothetical protein